MKLTKRLIGTLYLMVLAILSVASGTAVASNLPRYAYYDQYPFIRILADDEEPQELTDEAFFDQSASIIFPVNGTELPIGSPLLRELEQNVIPQMNSDSLRIVRMVFRGAASPEGPFEVNQRLGQQRVQALYDFFASRITAPMAGSQLTIQSDIEDYRSLCIMMKRAGDPDYEVVRAICSQHLPNKEFAKLKEKLQKANGGKLWTRLLREYFPQLRAARFVIYLQKIQPMVPTKPIETAKPTEDITNLEPVIPTTPISSIVVPEEPVITLPDTLPRREVLSVKTNMLFYGVYMPGYDRWCPIPNVAIEYYPKSGHFTFGASFDCPWWQNYRKHKYFQIRNYQLETRYYLKPAQSPTVPPSEKAPAYSGWYLQGYANMGIFGICFDANRGWVGEGLGAGVGVGYVMPISKNGHWRLEFLLQAGWFGCKYDPYKYENPVDPTYHDDLYYYKWTLSPSLFKKRQYRWNWLGPTRVGITLTYDLLYRRIQKKGVSFKNYEIYGQYEPNYEPNKPKNSQERRTAK